MTTKGTYLCGHCGQACDSVCEWRGVHFCDPTCRSMYVTEAAERERDWQQESEAQARLPTPTQDGGE